MRGSSLLTALEGSRLLPVLLGNTEGSAKAIAVTPSVLVAVAGAALAQASQARARDLRVGSCANKKKS